MSLPLRIAMISEHASPIACPGGADAGGQNIYVDKVSRELAARGHRVDVFTRRDAPSLPDVVEIAPRCRVFHVAAGPAAFVPKEELLPHMEAFSTAVERLASGADRHDLVHAHFFMSGLAALRLKAAHGTPIVMTFHALGLVRRLHQGASDRFPEARIEIERQLVAQSDTVVAECPQDADDLRRLYGASDRRMTLVPCGVDLDEFAARPDGAARRELGLGDDEFVVLQLGRMVPRKGVDDAVRAIGRLPATAAARLVVVGGDGDGDPETQRLRAIARRAGCAERVTFFAKQARARVPLFYAACDVFVSAPWYEPFGITPLEAMASGRPVIGSRVGGIRSTVVDGVTGLLVPPRDPVALARAIETLRLQPRLRRRMGEAGRRRAARDYTWAGVTSSLERAYETACNPGARLVRSMASPARVAIDPRRTVEGLGRAPLAA